MASTVYIDALNSSSRYDFHVLSKASIVTYAENPFVEIFSVDVILRKQANREKMRNSRDY